MLLYCMMIVQIISESLPVSSSGHVVLASILAKKYDLVAANAQDIFSGQFAAFNDAIQLVNAFIIFIFFFSIWWQLIVKKPVSLQALSSKKLWIESIAPVIYFGFIADVVTLFFWKSDCGKYLHLPLTAGFVITMSALLSLRWNNEKKDINLWSPKNAFIVGFIQGLALLPGISRFASTVAALCWCGYKQNDAVAISFLLQMPLLIAGSLLGVIQLHDSQILITIQSFSFLVTLLFAAIVSYLALSFVYNLAESRKLYIFSWYMVVPIALSLLI